ncbi:MAG: DUF1214 domain-containing protein [Anaerolineales bacterium]|nr:DUF1214 domain-containing protein [Anaerolineales bacterium]
MYSERYDLLSFRCFFAGKQNNGDDLVVLRAGCLTRRINPPPAKAFWSLSMYKLPEQLFIHNPLNRYVISSITEGLKYGEDGSLTVYLQHETPGLVKRVQLAARAEWPFLIANPPVLARVGSARPAVCAASAQGLTRFR